MEDQSITNTPDDTGVSQDTQPVEAEPVAAEQTDTDVTTQEAPQGDEPSTDDNSTTEWLKNKGVDPSSPEAFEKVAEMARNAEKAMHSKAQKASELEKVIDTGITKEAEDIGFNDEERLDLARIKTKLSVREFFDGNPDAKEYEQAMIAELATKPHLAGDLESLYANAVVKSGNLDAVKSQGKREALESLAAKQTAAVPTGNAVHGASTPAAITPANVDELVGKNSLGWFQKNQAAINKAMAG